MKVQKDKYGKRRPKLSVDDLEDGDVMLLKLASFEEVTIDDEDGKRLSVVLTFKETGDKVYWPNSTSLGILIEVYGKETDNWIGEAIPLARHVGAFRGKKYENLAVAAPEAWPDLFREAELPVPRSLTVKQAKRRAVTKPRGRGKK